MEDIAISKDTDPVDVRLLSLEQFVQILEKEGLEESFYEAAPEISPRAASTQRRSRYRMNTESFARDTRITALELFDEARRLVRSGKARPGASFSIDPAMMNFARNFVIKNDLSSKYELARSLSSGKCKGGGRHCPPPV